MKFTYLGCEGAPEVSTHYGIEFTIGVPVEVADAEAVAKLSKHQHFSAAEESVEQPQDDARAALVDAYTAKFGKAPHHRMATATIAKALED